MTITITSPNTLTTSLLELIYGDDYYSTSARAITFELTGFPTMVGATVVMEVSTTNGILSFICDVVDLNTIGLELTASQIAAIGVGYHKYDLQATLSDASVLTILKDCTLMISADVRGSSQSTTIICATNVDADTLDGEHASAFADAVHAHASDYSAITHAHASDYSAITHTHVLDDLTDVTLGTPSTGHVLSYDTDHWKSAVFPAHTHSGTDVVSVVADASTLDGVDSTSFTLLGGRAGGQVLQGGTAANEDLVLEGTAHATKTTSYVVLQPTAGNVGIGTATPTSLLDVLGASPTVKMRASDSSGYVQLYFSPQTIAGVEAESSITSSWVDSGMVFRLPRDVDTHGYVFKNNALTPLFYINSSDGALSLSGKLKPFADGTTALTLCKANGDAVVTVDTTNGLLKLTTNGDEVSFSSRKGANSDGSNVWIGGGGQSSIGEAGATSKGSRNSAFGLSALNATTEGSYNSAFGFNALAGTTVGSNNSAIGTYALNGNTSGIFNTALGHAALLANTTGASNSACGVYAIGSNTTGASNSALGVDAGRFIADGATGNITSGTSLYLGAATKALADNGANEIVIGYNAIGAGSNTVTLGNTAITRTVLRGAQELTEMTAPGAGAANTARIYAVDNGGKTELVVQFATGAPIQLAIEA